MPFHPRIFTLEEANQLLEEIKPLTAEIVQLAAKMGERLDAMHVLQFLGGEDADSPEHAELKDVKTEIDNLLKKINKNEWAIREKGCYLKDIHIGLVDFYSFRNGELIFLCWRWGEKKVCHWHYLNKGCPGRKAMF